MWFRENFLRAAVLLLFMTVSLPALALICSTDANQAIPGGSGTATPGAPAIVTITVPSSAGGAIIDLDFQLQINHTYIGDLIVTLASPAGTVVTLLDRPGLPAIAVPYGCSRNNINVTLDDAAATLAEDQCDAGPTAMTGTRQPTGTLADFNGELIDGTWTISVTDNAGGDFGTIIAGGVCLGETTTPVTVNSFSSRLRGRHLIAKWQTASEAFNLGFHLWGKVDGAWVQLNQRLVPSNSVDSVVPQDYRRRVDVGKLDGDLTQVGISAFSSAGQEDFFGPFELGEEYGDEGTVRYVDWAEQRGLFDASMREAGYVNVNNRWIKLSDQRRKREEKRSLRYGEVNLAVRDQGIYRVTFADLLSQGFDLSGMPISKLALTNRGVAIPRIVKGSSANSRRFGPGSEIVFFGRGPTSGDLRYVDRNHYKISYAPALALTAPTVTPSTSSDGVASFSEQHLQAVSMGDKTSYTPAMPGNDPWYDSFIQAYNTVGNKKITLDVPASAKLEGQAALNLKFLGGLDFTNNDADGDGIPDPDHHIKVYLNRESYPEAVADMYRDGINRIDLDIDILGQLRHGANEVDIEIIPDNGYNIDAAYFIGASIEYSVDNTLLSDYLDISLSDESSWVRVSDPQTRVSSAYAYDLVGNFLQLELTRDTETGDLLFESPVNSASANEAGLWLASDDGFLAPEEIFAVPEVDSDALNLTETDYVIIADPSLMGDDLERFAQAQRAMQRRTKIVNVKDIYNEYSDGLVLPDAIKAYLTQQSAVADFRYVLLAGWHSYNYRLYGVEEQDAPINLIPSFYRSSDAIIKQIPTAVPFVDFDNNGTPDRAIGRWPVRNKTQLKNVVDKTLAWHADGSHAESQTAVFLAGLSEPKNDFDASLDRVSGFLGLSEDLWSDVERVYMDELTAAGDIEPGQEAQAARTKLVDAINQGAALTMFSGHASTTLWGYQSLLTATVAERFTNSDKPSLMVPLSCYTSYYETPNVLSLSEILLTDSQAGAVAISSAAMLSRPADNEQIAKALLYEMTVKGSDLGTAELAVKREIHSYSPRHQALIHNWTTLGDPSLSFKNSDITPEIEPEVPKSP